MPSIRHDYHFPESKAGHPHHWQHFCFLCCAQSCLPLGSSVHGIFQVRILEWVAIPSSRGSSQPRGRTRVSCIACIAASSLLLSPRGSPQWQPGPFPMQNLSGSGWQRGEMSSPSFRGSFYKRHQSTIVFAQTFQKSPSSKSCPASHPNNARALQAICRLSHTRALLNVWGLFQGKS